MSENVEVERNFGQAFLPIGFFLIMLIYGLLLHPLFFSDGMLPVEIIILAALTFSCFHLFRLGYEWEVIQDSISTKVGESIPVVFILFAVGVLIGSWIVSGTIPMLIYYGISIIDPTWIYLFAYLICIVFSLLTGTSWGSAGTIGVVMIGIAQVYHVDLAITAAAVVGGSFFGDKMSPLSDTTNVASLATDVPLLDHIKSMMYTTGPSAIIAGLLYFGLSYAMQDNLIAEQELDNIDKTLFELKQIFEFNIVLLVPLVVVVWGSVKKKPIILTLLSSAWLAMILAFIFQDFSVSQVFQSFNKGFSVAMAPDSITASSDVVSILNRGGLYNLIEGVVICLLIFAFIGTLDVINAIETSIKRAMDGLKTQAQTIVVTLLATFATNVTTSNQYATSFIIGSAFKKKYDTLKIPRKVLSRSIEDAGTMMENLFPWTPSGIFMAATLGVSSLEYAPYQFLSIINFGVAIFFGITGIACFTKASVRE